MNKLMFSEKLSKEFLEAIKREIPFRDEKVAIKLHMGEPKNKNHLKPEEVKEFVKILKELGCEPFLFDTTVNYNGKRHTKKGYKEVVKINGFDKIGCPIVIGGREHEIVKGKLDYEVAKELCGVSVLVLTHVKGHVCTGIGGAIKNLGMGAMTKKTKGEIHHGGKPKYIGGCVLCKNCVRACPLDTMKVGKQGPILPEHCYGCSNCVLACKHGAIKTNIAQFDFLLAEAAKSAIKKFKKVYYVNFLKTLAKECDCENKPLKPVMPDIGIVAGKNILSIEQASYDLIIKKAGEDIFKKLNKKSFNEQLKCAEQLKMGSRKYEIKCPM